MRADNVKGFQTTIVLLIAAALQASCGSKPPGCADPETVALTRDILVGKVLKDWPEGSAMRENDPSGLLVKFTEGVTVKLNTVTTNGYDSKAKQHSCEGTLQVDAEGESLSIPIEYSTQATESGSGEFVLRMSPTGMIVPGLRGKAAQYWRAHRYVGDWSGLFACDGLDGNATGPAGPFTMNVNATVDGAMKVRLDRLTRGGGSETLMGELSDSGAFKAQGKGANSPDDVWQTQFNGQIEGEVLNATGAITPSEGTSSRSCRLTLKHVANAAGSSSPPASKP